MTLTRKTVPVLVKDTAEEDVLLESLIENLHRLDLTSTERENAIYALWNTQRWKTYEELSKALGKGPTYAAHHIEAARIRRNERVESTIPTYIITKTQGLEPQERKRVIAKIEKGEIPPSDVNAYARAVRVPHSGKRTEATPRRVDSTKSTSGHLLLRNPGVFGSKIAFMDGPLACLLIVHSLFRPS